jgi:NADH-quinone oxidoreductase subunit A
VGVLFILFEAGIVFLYPWSLVLSRALRRGLGTMLVVEMMVFLGLIALALLYAWGRGALEWEE